MPIAGTIQVSGQIAPTDDLDTFPTHDDQYSAGGWRLVADVAERDAIPMPRRKAGMVVVIRSLGMQMQVLADDIVTSRWNFVGPDWISLNNHPLPGAFVVRQQIIQ